MKGYVWTDEMYPVYGIDKDYFLPEKMVEIPDKLYEQWLRAKKLYNDVQRELEKYSCE